MRINMFLASTPTFLSEIQEIVIGTCCCFSVPESWVTLCDPTDCCPPGFPVLHYLLELAQTHVHRVNGAIQPSHPLSPPSSPAFNLSQHSSLFQWVNSEHQVAKYWSFSFNINPSNDYSGLIYFSTDCIDLLPVQGLSRVFSSSTVQKH